MTRDGENLTGAPPSGTRPPGRVRGADGDGASSVPALTVIIPAHDEAMVLPRLLGALDVPDVEIIVVCNGCTDGTADIARMVLPRATVLETATPSKVVALQLGDAAASTFPRFYLDADIELDAPGLRELAARLTEPGRLAVAPSVAFDVSSSSYIVRAYYRVLPLLPVVADSIAGTGCIGLSREGRSRFGEWPLVLADDYFLDGLFGSMEKARIANVVARVGVPLRARDLVRRRQRVIWGNRQVEAMALRHARSGSGRGLLTLVWKQPRRAFDVLVFASVAVWVRGTLGVARLRGHTIGWNRDQSRVRVT